MEIIERDCNTVGELIKVLEKFDKDIIINHNYEYDGHMQSFRGVTVSKSIDYHGHKIIELGSGY